jgi:glycine cleavage system pyridoxal-binding protein P
LVKTKDAKQIYDAAINQGMNLRLVDQEHLAISFDEQSSSSDLNDLLNLFKAKIFIMTILFKIKYLYKANGILNK